MDRNPDYFGIGISTLRMQASRLQGATATTTGVSALQSVLLGPWHTYTRLSLLAAFGGSFRRRTPTLPLERPLFLAETPSEVFDSLFRLARHALSRRPLPRGQVLQYSSRHRTSLGNDRLNVQDQEHRKFRSRS